MKKTLITIAVFIFTLVIGQAVSANPMCGMNKMIMALKLSDEQQKQVEAIRNEFKQSQKNNWQQMQASHDKITNQIQSEKLDQAKLDQGVNQLAQQLGATIKAKALMKNRIFILLNPQQKTQFVSMMKEKEERIKNMFKKCDDDKDHSDTNKNNSNNNDDHDHD